MTLTEYIEAVHQKTKIRIDRQIVRYVRDTGRLTPPEKFGGWYRYETKHVAEMALYLRTASRLKASK